MHDALDLDELYTASYRRLVVQLYALCGDVDGRIWSNGLWSDDDGRTWTPTSPWR